MADDSDRKQPKNPLGPTGDRVMANIKRLRQSRGLTYKELSEQLERLGRPIPVLGLSRLERGERRVDVDDLVALAVALEVSPNALLMPDTDDLARSHKATPAVTATSPELWAWAEGEVPLGHNPASVNASELDRYREATFILRNMPHHFRRDVLEALSDMSRAATSPKVPGAGYLGASVVSALFSGMTTAELRNITESIIIGVLTRPEEEILAEIEKDTQRLKAARRRDQ